MSPLSIEGLFLIIGAVVVFLWSLRDDTDDDDPGSGQRGGGERGGGWRRDLAPLPVRADDRRPDGRGADERARWDSNPRHED